MDIIKNSWELHTIQSLVHTVNFFFNTSYSIFFSMSIYSTTMHAAHENTLCH